MFFHYAALNLLSVVMVILLVLVGIAFLTLLERKFLGYIQNRKGPNKVGYKGIIQPFSEAVKLFSKEVMGIYKTSKVIYFLSPVLSMFLLLVVWVAYPYGTNVYFLNYSILLIILALSLNSYVIMLMGWSSSSLYSVIGCIRSVAQLLSYEVSFIVIILVQMLLCESYSLIDFFKWQEFMWFAWGMLPLLLIFFISVLAELNRGPMDLVEGESELVSGFNVEYFGGPFALIFLAEYGMIIFMSLLIAVMYMGGGGFSLTMSMSLVMLMVILMRGILPRVRYDELMYLCWKVILPVILNYLIWFMFVKVLLNIVG